MFFYIYENLFSFLWNGNMFLRVPNKQPSQSCDSSLTCRTACDLRAQVSLRTAVGSGGIQRVLIKSS